MPLFSRQNEQQDFKVTRKRLLQDIKNKVPDILKDYDIIFAYVFGSIVNKNGKYFLPGISDIDFGLYFAPQKKNPTQDFTQELIEINGKIAITLGYDKIDTVAINLLPTQHPIILSSIFQQGKLIYCTDQDILRDFIIDHIKLYEDYRLFHKKMLKLLYER